MGAVPVTESEDVLRPSAQNRKFRDRALSPLEEKVVTILFEPLRRDELIRKIGLR